MKWINFIFCVRQWREILFQKKMERLPAPYGDCIPNGKTSEYIYEDYEYSAEVRFTETENTFFVFVVFVV